MPFFNRLSSGDCAFHCIVDFIPNQRVYTVLFGKPFNQIVLVLAVPPSHVGDYPHIQNIFSPAGQEVHIGYRCWVPAYAGTTRCPHVVSPYQNLHWQLEQLLRVARRDLGNLLSGKACLSDTTHGVRIIHRERVIRA